MKDFIAGWLAALQVHRELIVMAILFIAIVGSVILAILFSTTSASIISQI